MQAADATNGSPYIAVIGAGSWGTALAILLARNGCAACLWGNDEQHMQLMRAQRENPGYLPGIKFPQALTIANTFHEMVNGTDTYLLVVPSHAFRVILEQIRAQRSDLHEQTLVAWGSKGFDSGSGKLLGDFVREVLGAQVQRSVISGPSFAREVAQKMPTSVTVACKNPEIAANVQHVFATTYFRVYTSDDVIGVELGGSVKNVIAIASGMLDGLGMGLNTRAALITRGMTEIRRLGLHLGANPRTFTGLAGFGDLVLTCTGNLSRNYTVGIKLGKGKKLQQILDEMHMVAEGVKTAKSVYNFSRKLGVEMPICHEIYRILYEDLTPKEALYRLMTRTLKQELDEE